MKFLVTVLVGVVILNVFSEAIEYKQLFQKRKDLGFKNYKQYCKYLYEELEKLKAGMTAEVEATTTVAPDADGAVTDKDMPEEHEATEAPAIQDPVLAQAFIDAHNHARSAETEASPALPPVVWDATLAAKCEVNVGQCKMSHDQSSFRKEGTAYSWVGQNLYMRSCSISYTDEEYAQRAVNAWMGEKKDWDTATKKCKKAWYYCGHYTQVVWGASTNIGCAVKSCGRQTYVCCNYGPGGNWNGETPY